MQSDFQHQYISKLLINLNMLYDCKTITNYLHLGEHPHLIWFSSHEEIGNFVKYVVSPHIQVV